MLVFDTSAYITGWRVHYPPDTFPSVWQLFEQCMGDGRIVAPREVYNELAKKDDAVFAWAKEHESLFVEPSEEVQRALGPIVAKMPKRGVRDVADPFVIAEAQVREYSAVTYEGTNTITGARTKRWEEKMPGICDSLGIPCCIVPQALAMLGVQF